MSKAKQLFAFKVTADEDSLGKALARLVGVKVEIGPSIPVHLADDRPYAEIIELKGPTISTTELKAQIEAAGKPASSLTYCIKTLIKEKLIKSSGTRGIYKVIKKGAKA